MLSLKEECQNMNVKLKGKKYSVTYKTDEANKIGAGGNGTVYKARIKALKNSDTRYVIKVFRCGGYKSERYERFKREVQTVSEQLKDVDGVLPIIDYCLPENLSDQNQAWYLMPEAKKFRLNDSKTLAEKLKLMIDLAKIIESLHKKDIVHRDIKPDNILMYKGKIILSDFGLVACHDDNFVTEPGERVGPIKILPPELESIEEGNGIEVYKNSDVYLFAKVLWMYLKQDTIGFRGEYRRSDSQLGLSKDMFQVSTIEPLHELMSSATRTKWHLRITITECIELLKQQLDVIYGKVNPEIIKMLKNKEHMEFFTEKNEPQETVYTDVQQITTFLGRLESFAIIVVNHDGQTEEEMPDVKFSLKGKYSSFKKFIDGKQDLEILGLIDRLYISKNDKVVTVKFKDCVIDNPKYKPYSDRNNELLPQRFVYVNSSYEIKIQF